MVLEGWEIIDEIRKVWKSEKIIVEDRGLREGIMKEMM